MKQELTVDHLKQLKAELQRNMQTMVDGFVQQTGVHPIVQTSFTETATLHEKLYITTIRVDATVDL